MGEGLGRCWSSLYVRRLMVLLLDVEMDYKYVRELMMRWDLTPKKLPFEKFLYVPHTHHFYADSYSF